MWTKKRMLIIFSSSVYALFYGLFRGILDNSPNSDYYSHITAVPLVAASLIYVKNKWIPSKDESFPKTGIVVIAAGMLICVGLKSFGPQLQEYGNLCLLSLMAVTFWTGGLIACYGLITLQNAAAPLLILGFMFPIPPSGMDGIILFLQTGSANVAEGLFSFASVPYSREGFIFHLPTLSVEVAKTCSGIHSTIALAITGVCTAFIFLQTTWKRAILVASIIPITILKNGIRIFVLSVLGAYKNESILLDGWLHRSGGILFFILALTLLWVVLWGLGMERITSASNAEATG